MIDIMIGGILLVTLGGAIRYIIKAKKAGVKCVGCSESCSCSVGCKMKNGSECGCGCHSEME